MEEVVEKKKFKIKFTKKNIVKTVFFVFFAVQIVALLLQALITAIVAEQGGVNPFLFFWPFCCAIICGLLLRSIYKTSK